MRSAEAATRASARIVLALASIVGSAITSQPCLAQPPVAVGPPATLSPPVALPPVGVSQLPIGRPPGPDPFWGAAPSGYAVIAGPKAIELGQAGGPFDHRPMEVHHAEPYAYGWFGGVDRSKWHRQFGPHRRYTQWSLR